ncbi:hypothetical protein BGZ68_004841 [Mortierella alpina]|nr:hypothetical protein BGZ68_004841 [Mortierella alpina]
MAGIIHQPQNEPELTDYNKLYNTPAYNTYNADVHPLAAGHPAPISTTTAGYGPLDYGPYADVSRAQAQHMERIREAERNLHRTHNADGLPLPQENGQRRRSSLAHILRLDKPLLARYLRRGLQENMSARRPSFHTRMPSMQDVAVPAKQVISQLQRWYVPAIGEFVGTAMFLYLAVGGADAVTRGASEGTAILGVAFAFGMGLMVTAWGFGRISGAHFNPAITLACLITGNVCIGKAVMYFVCQLLGACLGVAMARGTTPHSEQIGQINYLHNGESIARGFFLEFWLTSILCFVYLMTTEERNKSSFMAPLPIGFTLFSCHLFATRYTNSSINPARAFATSLVSRRFTDEHWIYWFGPFGGGIVAAALYIFFCYFDFDIVTAANKAQLRAEAAAAPGEVVKVDVVSASAASSSLGALAINPSAETLITTRVA